MAANPFAQQQKILMYVFPIMFAVFGVNFPVGVLLYWLTTNLWTMGQQLFVIQRNPTPGSIAFKARQERLAEKARKQGKVLTPEGEVVDAAEYEARQAAEKERAAKRTQPTRTSKSKRKGGGGGAGGTGGGTGGGTQGSPAQRPAVKGSTARTPPSGANGTGATPSQGRDAAEGTANGQTRQQRQQARKQTQSRKGRKKS